MRSDKGAWGIRGDEETCGVGCPGRGALGTQRAGGGGWTPVVGAKQSQRLKMGQIRGERDPNPAS